MQGLVPQSRTPRFSDSGVRLLRCNIRCDVRYEDPLSALATDSQRFSHHYRVRYGVHWGVPISQSNWLRRSLGYSATEFNTEKYRKRATSSDTASVTEFATTDLRSSFRASYPACPLVNNQNLNYSQNKYLISSY